MASAEVKKQRHDWSEHAKMALMEPKIGPRTPKSLSSPKTAPRGPQKKLKCSTTGV